MASYMLMLRVHVVFLGSKTYGNSQRHRCGEIDWIDPVLPASWMQKTTFLNVGRSTLRENLPNWKLNLVAYAHSSNAIS